MCDCYERLDWRLINRDIRSGEGLEQLDVVTSDLDDSKVPYVIGRFKKEPEGYGYLLFAGIGSDGVLVPAPSSLSAFTHRVWNRIDASGVWNQSEVIMLQMWITTKEKLDHNTLRKLETEFVSARAAFASSIQANAANQQTSLRPSGQRVLYAKRASDDVQDHRLQQGIDG